MDTHDELCDGPDPLDWCEECLIKVTNEQDSRRREWLRDVAAFWREILEDCE